MISPTKHYPLFFKALIIIIFVMLGLVVSARNAPAVMATHIYFPCPGDPNCSYPIIPANIPVYAHDYLSLANTYPQTPAYIFWVSAANNTTTSVMTVPYGTSSVALSYNVAAVKGWVVPAYATYSRSCVLPWTPFANFPDGVCSLVNAIEWTNVQWRWGSMKYSFNYAPPGGFTATGDYIIPVSFKSVNKFSNDNWVCVSEGAVVNATEPTWTSVCPVGTRNFTIHVIVPPIYTGTIKIEKHLVGGDNDPLPSGSTPYNARVGITNNINSWNPQGTSNPFSYAGIYVNTLDPTKNTQHPNTTHSNPTHVNNDGSYNAYVDVPAGFEVASYTVDGSPNPQNARNMSCTGANNTGRCKVNAIRVGNNATTTVKFYFRLPSKGSVSCRPGVKADGTPDGRFYWRGYGIDATSQDTAPIVELYEGSTKLQTIAGNWQVMNNGVYTTYVNNRSTYPGMLATTNYNFKVDLESVFHDGRTRIITPKLVTAIGTYLTLPNVDIPGPDCGGTTVFAWAWPWLQTSGGDVIASGEIKGQDTSSSDDSTPGARRDNAPDKEAEFLIISAVGGPGPFCSTYNYILTNINATGGSCDNGAGYILNSYPLNSDGNDVIVEGVKKAFDTFSTANGCSGDKSTAQLATITVPPQCLDGAVYKLTGGNTLSTNDITNFINVTKGRVTIYVEGNLDITANICYATTPACTTATGGITNIKDYPNLAIVVKGNVNIASSVTNISALIYASGKIDTCATAAGSSPTQDCFNRLTVRGSLIAKGGIKFGRSFYNTDPLPTANRPPAEWIALTPQTFLYPAPGIDHQSTYSQQEGAYTLDPGEYNPRF